MHELQTYICLTKFPCGRPRQCMRAGSLMTLGSVNVLVSVPTLAFILSSGFLSFFYFYRTRVGGPCVGVRSFPQPVCADSTFRTDRCKTDWRVMFLVKFKRSARTMLWNAACPHILHHCTGVGGNAPQPGTGTKLIGKQQ